MDSIHKLNPPLRLSENRSDRFFLVEFRRSILMSNLPQPSESTDLPSGKRCPSFLKLAMSRPIVLRSLLIAVVVGSILCGINHGPCMFGGKFSKGCLFQSLLTAVVPYVVSVVSSVQALRCEQAKG